MMSYTYPGMFRCVGGVHIAAAVQPTASNVPGVATVPAEQIATGAVLLCCSTYPLAQLTAPSSRTVVPAEWATAYPFAAHSALVMAVQTGTAVQQADTSSPPRRLNEGPRLFPMICQHGVPHVVLGVDLPILRTYAVRRRAARRERSSHVQDMRHTVSTKPLRIPRRFGIT